MATKKKDEKKKDDKKKGDIKKNQQEAACETPDIACNQENEAADIAAELEKKCEEYLQMAQRARADFDNYKRRNETAKSQAYADGMTDALSAMLPVMDNFDRAVAAIPQDEGTKAILDGVLMVKKQLDAALAGKGISEIPSEKGEKFDPELHNAVMTAALEDGCEAGTIAATFQKGYKLNEKVIRYAMVSVFNE